MNAQSTQPTKKTLEYQEAGLALRAAEQARRTAITIFGTLELAVFGFLFAEKVNPFTLTYMSLVGLIVAAVSYLLLIQNNKTIKVLRDRLCVLQSEVTARVYSDSTDTGLWERRFYKLIHSLAGLTLVFVVSYGYINASNCNYLPWQDCGIFRSECPVEGDCPCGENSAQITDVIQACPIESP